MSNKPETAMQFDNLEKIAAKLIQNASNLLASLERHNIVAEIEKFRLRIAALKAKGTKV
jgi:hypothetical protein